LVNPLKAESLNKRWFTLNKSYYLQFKARTIYKSKKNVNRLSFSPAGGQHAQLAELIM